MKDNRGEGKMMEKRKFEKVKSRKRQEQNDQRERQ